MKIGFKVRIVVDTKTGHHKKLFYYSRITAKVSPAPPVLLLFIIISGSWYALVRCIAGKKAD